MPRTTLPLAHLSLQVCTDEAHPQPAAMVELAAPVALAVEYHYSPGTPDVAYLPNGDPGDPGDPEELAIIEATCLAPVRLAGDGVTVTISSGLDLLPLLSPEAHEDLELDLKRVMDEDDA